MCDIRMDGLTWIPHSEVVNGVTRFHCFPSVSRKKDFLNGLATIYGPFLPILTIVRINCSFNSWPISLLWFTGCKTIVDGKSCKLLYDLVRLSVSACKDLFCLKLVFMLFQTLEIHYYYYNGIYIHGL